ISRGTAKKAFRGHSRDATLSKLVIGGKTGSLYNKEHTVKYDWFTGFGKEKKGNRKIVLSIVVGHRKYIGTRASQYGKKILKLYFKKPAKPVQS
ncbi:MAG: PbpA, partial [Desulfobacteraceae bacterium]|nr:PbpA [Desulfobacteraceae bacterium]